MGGKDASYITAVPLAERLSRHAQTPAITCGLVRGTYSGLGRGGREERESAMDRGGGGIAVC